MKDFREALIEEIAPQPNPLDSQLPPINLGSNDQSDGTFWFKTGLSLITESRNAPPAFLEQFEEFCIPGGDIATGDIVVFYKGTDLFATKKVGDKMIIDPAQVDVIRFGVAYEDSNNQMRVISQDEQGTVWDHSLKELPQYSQYDWDFYGLRIPTEQTDIILDSRYPQPDQVIEVWLKQKQ
jgi:hypothetical protein